MRKVPIAAVFQIALVILCPFIGTGHSCGDCDAQAECRVLECVHDDSHDHDHFDVPLAPHECPHESQQCNNCVCDGVALVASYLTSPPSEPISLERLTLNAYPSRVNIASLRHEGSYASFQRLSGWEIRALIESLTL